MMSNGVDRRRSEVWPFAALAVSATAVLVLSVVVLPDVLVGSVVGRGHLSPSELVTATNDVRTTLIQALGGIVLVVGAYLTWRQTQIGRQAGRDELHLAREGMMTDRFTRAVDQLGHEAASVRCGGIFALERIGRESPADLSSIVQILAAHVRSHAPWPPSGGPATATPIDDVSMLSVRLPDVQAAVTVVGRRAPMPRDPRFWIAVDLTGVDLRRAQLQKADLRNARLRGSNLSKAWLGGADLRGADLRDALLDGASLQGAIADLTTWWPSDTFDAAAQGVHIEPDLVGADLRSAYLRNVDLTGVRLAGALADNLTEWPPGFDWRAAGVRFEQTPPGQSAPTA